MEAARFRHPENVGIVGVRYHDVGVKSRIGDVGIGESVVAVFVDALGVNIPKIIHALEGHHV